MMAMKMVHPFKDAALPDMLSFFGSQGKNVFISTIKKAADSNEAVIRIFSLNDKDQLINVEGFWKIKEAYATTLTEAKIRTIITNSNITRLLLGHHAVETIRFQK